MRHDELAHLCELAYNDDVKLWSFNTHKIFDVETDTQCFLLYNATLQIVVFRGTELSLTNWTDVITDLKIKPYNGVHEGFQKAFNSIKTELLSELDFDIKTIFCGHSLGGALAILAYNTFEVLDKTCVTFGAPRVYQKDLAEFLKENGEDFYIFRYENLIDPVTFLPPLSFGYRHIGTPLTESNPLPFFFSTLSHKLKSHSITTYIKALKK